MDHALHRTLRTTTSRRDHLTTAPHGSTKNQWNTRQRGRSTSHAQPHNQPLRGRRSDITKLHRWVEANHVAVVEVDLDRSVTVEKQFETLPGNPEQRGEVMGAGKVGADPGRGSASLLGLLVPCDVAQHADPGAAAGERQLDARAARVDPDLAAVLGVQDDLGVEVFAVEPFVVESLDSSQRVAVLLRTSDN